MRQIGCACQAQRRCIVTPERALKRPTMIVERPLVHRASPAMIREQPEANLKLCAGESSNLYVDGVVTDHFVPQLDLHQNFASLIHRLSRFAYLNSGRGG